MSSLILYHARDTQPLPGVDGVAKGEKPVPFSLALDGFSSLAEASLLAFES